MKEPKVQTTKTIIIDKCDKQVLARALDILNQIKDDYDCENAVSEMCSFQMYQLCESLSELLDITRGDC